MLYMAPTPLKSQIPVVKRFWKSSPNCCFFEKVTNLKVKNMKNIKRFWKIFLMGNFLFCFATGIGLDTTHGTGPLEIADTSRKTFLKKFPTLSIFWKLNNLRELSRSWDRQTMKSEKNRHFWEYEFFPSSNPQKPSFSLKLDTMRMSKLLTATKKNKN